MLSNQNSTLSKLVEQGIKLTPMMEQYYKISKQYPGIFLMFRMGDFYELFFEDAVNASKLLNISLTHRGKLADTPIPMAGIPHHAASNYIDRLTELGHKVAICEQVEDPKATKGIVKRAVTQVASPGMPFNLDKTQSVENRFIASAVLFQKQYYLSLIDFTTGAFIGLNCQDEKELWDKLQLYKPKEFITYLGQWEKNELIQGFIDADEILTTNLSLEYFDYKLNKHYISKLIPSFEKDKILITNEPLLQTIAALSYYICSTQSLDEISHIKPYRFIANKDEMKVTYTTLVGLEIMPKNRESYKNSLLGFMDKTKSALGARALKSFFMSPTACKNEIIQRQSYIHFFQENINILNEVRSTLDQLRDIERIMAKLSSGKINASDLINLSLSAAIYKQNYQLLENSPLSKLNQLSSKSKLSLEKLGQKIELTLNNEIGASLDKGNLIKDGVSKKRDKLKSLTQNASQNVLELEARYRKETGINNLKIKHNNVAGYFVEVSKSHTSKVPESFTRRQTLVNSERYQTQELAAFEKELISAKDKLYFIEKEMFDALILEVKEQAQCIQKMSQYLAFIDIFQSLAFVAIHESFSCPNIVNKKMISLKEVWHPLIKQVIKDNFIPHNICLDDNQYFGLVTGPNMAGKTTVMREVAIVQFLAQIGSFVPASYANIGLCDYLFSRLGASDDIIQGQSTFMVEMTETAEIIRHATKNSLIILDEIGRGTSTYDGLSIAWSLVEHFVKSLKSLTLFSTHYHELIDLVEKLDHAKNLTVKTHNNNGEVEFLYELIEQGATQSFGIHVAKLAGLPNTILKRSGQILSELEADSASSQKQSEMEQTSQLSFLNNQISPQEQDLIDSLSALDLNNLSPKAALDWLYESQEKIR